MTATSCPSLPSSEAAQAFVLAPSGATAVGVAASMVGRWAIVATGMYVGGRIAGRVNPDLVRDSAFAAVAIELFVLGWIRSTASR
jgi:hypothetical protein